MSIAALSQWTLSVVHTAVCSPRKKGLPDAADFKRGPPGYFTDLAREIAANPAKNF